MMKPKTRERILHALAKVAATNARKANFGS
jgi:hypothetical protein